MEKIDSDDLRVYFVWQPVLPADKEDAALAHARAEKDPRARHVWDGANALGPAYGQPLPPPWKEPFAWDMVLLFPKGARWDDELPRPSVYMYPRQAGEAPAFDAAAFGGRVAELLPRE
jgi:hypothetical protein